MFEDFEIEIHCPECDAEMEVKFSQIAGEKSVTCPCCKNLCKGHHGYLTCHI